MKKKKKDYTIPFVGLKLGKHQFDYQIDKSFFADFDYDEINDVDVAITLYFNKKNTMLELLFEAEGSVNVNCDRSNEAFDLPIEGTLELVIKFGLTYEEVNEDLLIVPHEAHEIEIQQYLYEIITLSVPAKRVHPGVTDGTLQSEALKKLEELRPKSAEEKHNDGATDPRWDKLKTLLKDK